MPSSRFEDVVATVRSRIGGFRALAVVGLDGAVRDLTVLDASFDSSQLAEFATLLRIACRTSEDASTGPLSEMSWKSDRSIVLMSRIFPDRFLLLFGTGEINTGLARYTLGRAARRLALAPRASAEARQT